MTQSGKGKLQLPWGKLILKQIDSKAKCAFGIESGIHKACSYRDALNLQSQISVSLKNAKNSRWGGGGSGGLAPSALSMLSHICSHMIDFLI